MSRSHAYAKLTLAGTSLNLVLKFTYAIFDNINTYDKIIFFSRHVHYVKIMYKIKCNTTKGQTVKLISWNW